MVDILLILASAVISYFTSTSRFNLDLYHEEWSGLHLILYPAYVAAATIVIYILTRISRKFYNKNRWLIVGTLCGINLLAGILLRIGIFG